MAEAAVEERPPARFYCHVCNVEFQNAANNFTCPHCSDGFIEELQENREEDSGSTNFHAVGPWVEDSDIEDARFLLSSRLGTRGAENGGPMEARTLTRLASSNLRQPLPIEHLVHDFIINLGVGVNLGGPGNVQLFLGNPGDYAWGREGLDAIVTQLLNQMDSTGPPPVSKAVIDALQVVEVTEEQVAQNLQCSVCWEHFALKEQVRQLPCLHIYHEACIRPWLELHGTCPICRQNLGDGEGGNQGSSDQTGVEAATGQGIDFKQKIINLDGVPIKLQIWDTAGQERFRTLTTAYYRGAMGILLLYDVTNLESFNHITYWLQNIEENASPHCMTVIAGNKCESKDRIVETENGQKIAEHFDLPFLEVSCKDNINIEACFMCLARKIREKREQKGYPFLDAPPNEEKTDLLKPKADLQLRGCSSSSC